MADDADEIAVTAVGLVESDPSLALAERSAEAAVQDRRAVLWNALAAIVGPTAGLLLNVVLARRLGTVDFGVTVTALTVVTIAVSVFSFGLERSGLAVAGGLSGAECAAAIREIAKLNAGFALVGAVSVAALWRYLPVLDGATRMTISPLLVGGLVGVETWRVVMSDAQRLESGARGSLLTGIGVRTAAAAIILWLASLLGAGLTGSQSILVLTGASAILGVAAARSLMRPHATVGSFDRAHGAELRRRLTRQGGEVMVAGLGRVCLTNLDVLIVAGFFEPREVASYALATRIANSLGALATAANLSAIPILARSWRTGTARARAAIDCQPSSTTALVAGLVLGAGVALAGGSLVDAVFGSGFDDAALLIRVMLIGQVLNLATGVSGAFLLIADRVRVTIVITSISAAVTLAFEYGLGLAGSPLYTIAAASTAGFAVENLVAWRYVQRVFGVNCAPTLNPTRWPSAMRATLNGSVG